MGFPCMTPRADLGYHGHLPGRRISVPEYSRRTTFAALPRGAQRRALIATGRGIEANTYNSGSKRLYPDLSADYVLNRRFTLFGCMRNIKNQTEDSKIYGPNTPDYAKLRQRVDYGSAWTFGLRGTF